MLMYDYIIFVQLSVKECVNYKQCLISLQTAWVDYPKLDAIFMYTLVAEEIGIVVIWVPIF